MIIDVVLCLIVEVYFEYMKSSSFDYFFFVFFLIITSELSFLLFLSLIVHTKKKYTHSHSDRHRSVTPQRIKENKYEKLAAKKRRERRKKREREKKQAKKARVNVQLC